MKMTEADIDWQHAHGIVSTELYKAKAEIVRLDARVGELNLALAKERAENERLREVLRAIKACTADQVQGTIYNLAKRALEQSPRKPCARCGVHGHEAHQCTCPDSEVLR